MKVKDLTRRLNKIVKVNFDLSKIHTHADLHNQLATYLFRSGLLPGRIKTRCWELLYIKIGDENIGNAGEPIIKYDRDFVKDKRCKWEDRGTFSNVRFTALKEVASIEISKLQQYFERKDKKLLIQYYQTTILKAEEDIAKAKAKLAELEE